MPTLLILLQPDFGTAMLVGISGAFALFLAGLSWWWFVAAAGGVAAVAPVAWFWLLRPYQKDRILTFLNPESDPLGTGWNIIQSKIAIGSGGWTGKGWGRARNRTWTTCPSTPPTSSSRCSARSSAGSAWRPCWCCTCSSIGRCLWIASDARDGYSRLLAGALALSLFVYVIVNGGMIAGLLPVVGVPMPLLSYGGTSAVSLLAGLGVVMAVRAHKPVHGTEPSRRNRRPRTEPSRRNAQTCGLRDIRSRA